MAKVLGFDPQAQQIYDLEQKIQLRDRMIEELMKLNDSYETEVKRLVDEYDKLYSKYAATQLLNL